MNILYKTDKDTPPPFDYAAYFERSCDPFNRELVLVALSNSDKPDLPETGWMAIDWFENPVGFISDGSAFKVEQKPDFEIMEGYFKDGRMFAYAVNNSTNELLSRHEKYKQERNKK